MPIRGPLTPSSSGSTPLPSAVRGRTIRAPRASTELRNPGVNNIDSALTKNFPIKGEKRYFSLRWEAYNAFNHTQFASINTAARFQPNGVQTNTLFGTVVSTRAPRIMQGSLRFTF